MKRIKIITILSTLVALAACGSGDAAGPGTDEDVSITEDGVIEPFACEDDATCAADMETGPCQEAVCVQGTCQVVTAINGFACDDGDPCTELDKCFQGTCTGEALGCDDFNLCTDDSCDPATGECAYVNNTVTCDDGNMCTEGDHCSDGACVSGENLCDCQTTEDCATYEDGDLCNGTMMCDKGDCLVDPDTIVDCTGMQVAACKIGYCEPGSGECKTKNAENGTSCDDADACTIDDLCKSGACAGDMLDPDDGNECTADSCDPAAGVQNTPVDNGTECNDGDLCTLDDMCTDGTCVGTENPDCACEADEDCNTFEDGDPCNGTLVCTAGACVVDEDTIVVCGATGSDCTTNLCNPSTGECEAGTTLNGTPCEDGNLCTEFDYCANGACVGLPVDCDDINACTADACDPMTGCVNEPIDGSCGDGDPCTLDDTCVEGACVGTPDPACECQNDVDCDAFEDDDLCNGTLICVDNKCMVDEVTVVDCGIEDLGACEFANCEPETGFCVVVTVPDGVACDDSDACTANDKCVAAECQGGPVTCDDGNVCTTDSCDPLLGCTYVYNTQACNDGNECTLNDGCVEGFCTGDPNPECQCQTDEDCVPFDDGNFCNGTLACVAYKCELAPDSVVECDTADDTTCLLTACQKDTGDCVQVALENGKACDDGDACTQVDACLGGVCMGSSLLACDDENPCTDDSCDAAAGCLFVPNADACDDGDPCTEGDLCLDGVCQPGEVDLCPELCNPDWTLSCGGSDAWNNGWSGSTDIITEYECSPYEYTGPEYTYTWTAPYDAMVTVTLTDEDAETDLMVLDNLGDGCVPANCHDYDFTTVTFEALAGQSYFFVVDGYEEGVFEGEGAYTISVDCQPVNELICDDGIDDDGDGLTDCDDEDDCLGTEACPLPICEPSWDLACGESDAWGNYYSGHTNQIEDYTCSNWSYPGPEYTYTFISPVTKTITVTLTEETAATDLMVLAGGGEGLCDPDECLAYGFSTVTFDAEAGALYYLVVDGFAGAEGTYTITVECPPDVEAICDDGLDDDDDGLTDCDDEDCALSEACLTDCNPAVSPFAVSCGFEEDWFNYGSLSSDKVDNWGCTEDLLDGQEYVYNFTAPYDAVVTIALTDESAETDLLVVPAGDGCAPADCLDHDLSTITFEATAGTLYYVIVDGYQGAEGSYHISFGCVPESEQVCDDGLDEDQDGLADCLDADCFGGDLCEDACVADNEAAYELSCGSHDEWSNNGMGSFDLIDGYPCNSYSYEGPEYAYTLVVDEDSAVTIVDDNIDIDILVLEDLGTGCNPAACMDYGLNNVTFDALAGVTYYVVMDGYNGAEGEYVLDVTCE